MHFISLLKNNSGRKFNSSLHRNKINNMRNYTGTLHEDDHIMPLEEWNEAKNVSFGNYDGSGYWVKYGKRCEDEVFSSEPEDATHVVWYNK